MFAEILLNLGNEELVAYHRADHSQAKGFAPVKPKKDIGIHLDHA